MATQASGELRADVHSIEPIPEADKDSTGPQRCGSGRGPNIAPINWALGALGIVLKLGLWETIAVVVLGNLVGCAIFSAFTVMGHKTGVNQMVLSRSAFGRRGAYLPSLLMFLMTLGWIGVNNLLPGEDRGGHPRAVRDRRHLAHQLLRGERRHGGPGP